jgi:hypothetical protein
MVLKHKIPHIRIYSRSVEGGAGEKVKVAVFNGGGYDSSLEHDLRIEGFFAVAIKDPKPSDISEHPDFVLAPEWIRWLMPTPETSEAWVTSLGSSHDRNQLRKKLKPSHIESNDVRVEIKPLTVSDYKVWHESLYIPEIGGKTGAVLLWPKTEALSKKVTVTPLGTVADFYRIFMYHKDWSLIGGALWSVSHSESSLTTRAAAFEQKALARYELAIRGMEESILFAASHGLRWVEKYGHQCLGKKLRRRCENGKDTKRALHERVSRGSGKDGDGWRFVRVGDLKAFIFAKNNVRAMDKGFQNGDSWRDWQGSASSDGY